MGEQIAHSSNEESYTPVTIDSELEELLLSHLASTTSFDVVLFTNKGRTVLSGHNHLNTIRCEINNNSDNEMAGEQKERVQAIKDGQSYTWLYVCAGFPDLDIQRDPLFFSQRANQILRLSLEELGVLSF